MKNMFGIFKKKSEKEKIRAQSEKLKAEAFRLSSINRRLSDQKTYEAELLMDQIEKMS